MATTILPFLRRSKDENEKAAAVAVRSVNLKELNDSHSIRFRFIVWNVTAILFRRTYWANALVGSELNSNNRRFSDWTQCYPSNFCDPYGKLHQFAVFEQRLRKN